MNTMPLQFPQSKLSAERDSPLIYNSNKTGNVRTM